MPHRTFFFFMLPSSLAMVLFIFVPIVSVLYQSFWQPLPPIMGEVETCLSLLLGGCSTEYQVIEIPEGVEFVGFELYKGRSLLAFEEIKAAWAERMGFFAFIQDGIFNLPFYKALGFTLFYTLITTPFVLGLGLIVALVLDNIWRPLKGPAIFASLLPFIITPLIGSLVLFWMTGQGGLLYDFFNWVVFWRDDFSLRASVPMTWTVIAVYGVWHVTPFAFVVFYAGLQTVSRDQLEAAMIDGAPRFDRFRYVTLPHLMPLVTFVLLIHLMDAFRVLEPIFGFNAQANAQSISSLIYDHLVLQNPSLYGSAAATSVLTIIMVGILLTPVLVRTWRDFRIAIR